MAPRVISREEAAQLGAQPIRTISAEEAQQLGAKPVEPGGDDLQAFAEGALSSATFGLSDAALARGNPGGEQESKAPFPKNKRAASEAKARRETGAGMAGEIAGYFTPGPAAVGRLAQGIAGGAKLGVGATRALAGAVEGGLFGLSAAVNEDNMGDPKLTGEQVAAGTLGSALAGAGANLVFGKVADVGRSALVKAFGGGAIQGKLGELAENAVMKSVTKPGDLNKQHLRGRINEVGRFALDEGFTAGAPSFATASERAHVRAQEAWQGIDDALKAADGAGRFDPLPVALRMQSKVDELSGLPSMTSIQSRLQAEVDKMADPATAPTSFRKAWENLTGMLEQVGENEPKGLKKKLFGIRGEVQDELFGQVAKLDPQLGEMLKGANRDYGNAATFKKLSMKRADAAGGFGLTDLAIGAGIGGVGGLPAAIATKVARERGGFVLGSALDALAQSKTLPRMAKGFQLLVSSKLADPAFGGPFRQMLETASAKGAQDLLETHLEHAQDPEYMASIGLEHEDPAAVAELADRAHRLGALANASDDAGGEIDKSLGRFLGTQSGRAPSRAERPATQAEFDKLRASLKVLAAGEGADKASLSGLAPATAGVAQMTAMTAAQYLLDNAPKNPTEMLPPALQRPWAPPPGDLREWLRRVEVVADPRSVFDDMRDGSLTPTQVETLQAVYPRLFQDIQDRLHARLAEWDKPLDRRRRAQVDLLAGSIDDPAVTQLIQAAHMRSVPPKAGKPDGRESLDVEKNQQTQAQRLESDE